MGRPGSDLDARVPRVRTVKDLLKHDGTSFTNEELLNYVREKYHEASEGGFKEQYGAVRIW